MQGTDIVRSVMGCGPLSTGSFVFIQFSVQTADRGFILQTVRMKGIGVLRYRILGIELRYRFHVMFIYCSCQYNVYVRVQKIFILNITVSEYFVWIMTEG